MLWCSSPASRGWRCCTGSLLPTRPQESPRCAATTTRSARNRSDGTPTGGTAGPRAEGRGGQAAIHTLRGDACIIGARAGGAVAAAELAEAGSRVVVLEQGPEHDPDSFTARPPQMLARLKPRWRADGDARHPPIALPLGRGLGRTTLIKSGTCFLTPPPVLRRGGTSSGSSWTRGRCGRSSSGWRAPCRRPS
jgi:hypothetical protein